MFAAKCRQNSLSHSHLHVHNTHTCARSPSYLYSQVNAASSNFFITSPTPLVGWASMGLSGTPGRGKVTRDMEEELERKKKNCGARSNWFWKKKKSVMHISWALNSWETNCESSPGEVSCIRHFLWCLCRGGASAALTGLQVSTKTQILHPSARNPGAVKLASMTHSPHDTSASHPQLFLWQKKKKKKPAAEN